MDCLWWCAELCVTLALQALVGVLKDRVLQGGTSTPPSATSSKQLRLSTPRGSLPNSSAEMKGQKFSS